MARIINPKLYFPITEENLQETIKNEQLALVQIEEAILSNQDKAACIIIETIQAEGGDNHFRDEFLVELRRICDENEMLLIFDEVQTGIGITGKMWEMQFRIDDSWPIKQWKILIFSWVVGIG